MRLLFIPLIFLFLILFIPNVKAIKIFNVTGQTSQILNTGLATGLVGKQRMFCDWNYCYHVYSSRNGDPGTNFQIYMTKWLKNSTYPFDDILLSATYPTPDAVSPHALSFDVMDYDNEKFYMVYRNYTGYLKRTWVYKSNFSMVADDIISRSVNINELALASDFSIAYTNDSGNNENPREVRRLSYTIGYVNSSLANYYKQPRMINYIYIPETQETWLFYSNSTSVYLARYGENIVFIDYTHIQTGNLIKKSDYTTWNNEPTLSIYTYYHNGMVYFAIRQIRSGTDSNNNTWYVNAIDPVKTKEQNTLVYSGGSGQYLNLSVYDSWLSASNHSTALSFYYDDTPYQEGWYILYQRQVASIDYGGKEIMLLSTSKSCLCSEWVNISSCGAYMPNAQYQSRTCNPQQCNSQGQYVDCTETPPQIHYKNETYFSECSMTPVDPRLVSKQSCVASLIIPENCSDVSSDAKLYIFVDKNTLSCNGNNEFARAICNPLSQPCSYDTETCNLNKNGTFNTSYAGYVQGDTATAKFEIAGIGACSSNIGFLECGWDTVSIHGVLGITCTQVCGKSNVCYSFNGLEYSIEELPNCLPNVTDLPSHLCTKGCDEDSGLCNEILQQTTTIDQNAQPTSDVFGWIIDRAKTTFPSTVLYGFSLFTCIGVAIYTQVQLGEKSNMPIGLISFLGMMIFFILAGLLPIWLGLILGMGIVLLISRTLFKGD